VRKQDWGVQSGRTGGCRRAQSPAGSCGTDRPGRTTQRDLITDDLISAWQSDCQRTIAGVAKYTSQGKSAKQVLKDYEDGKLDADYGGTTVEYLHAAIMVKAAQQQRLWAMVAAIAAVISVAVAVIVAR
jgi:hypothetical protein